VNAKRFIIFLLDRITIHVTLRLFNANQQNSILRDDSTMTLITNEIHMLDGFKRTALVFAADRRITKLDGSYLSTQQKLFTIPYLEGGVSYFGLAVLSTAGRMQYISHWLRKFISDRSDVKTLGDFANQLRNALHAYIPADVLGKHASGFHICGYNALGLPEFWYLSNIGGMSDFAYTDIRPQYAEPTSDFLERDAKTLGWDGVHLESVVNGGWIYRNGDFRAHAVAFGRLDEILIDMLSSPNFKQLKTSEDRVNWVRFKMKFVSLLYKNYAKKQIIGTPIDVFCLTKRLP
jgi:hypothetical protein